MHARWHRAAKPRDATWSFACLPPLARQTKKKRDCSESIAQRDTMNLAVKGLCHEDIAV